jgi:hypothetical protein
MNEHGALGAVFPVRKVNGRVHFIEGGGTIPWMGLVNHGLTDPKQLHWGGWSGRFSRQRHANVFSRHHEIRADEQGYDDFLMFEADSEQETWRDPTHDEVFNGRSVPVWRFRRAMFNDFRGRMDWCVNPPENANHNPVAAFRDDSGDSIIRLTAKPGEILSLDASASSDPDGDEINTLWWIYSEAGTYEGDLDIHHPDHATTNLAIPEDAICREIHVILEVIDDNAIVPMYDYRRIVISVER